MSYAINEYLDYLHIAVNDASFDYDPDDVKDWQPVRFFVSGRWADAVWKTIDILCNKDTMDNLPLHTINAVRVESERRAHVVIETHDRLLFDMALCDSRFRDREAAKGQRTEWDVQDCICEIAQFRRYMIKPKAAKAMLSVFNEDATNTYAQWSENPEHQAHLAKYYPEGPKVLSSPEEIYLSAKLRRECPEGCVGSTWVDVLPGSWVGAYTLIMREHLRAEGVTRLTKDRLEYERAMLPDNEWINGYTDHLTEKEWRVVYTGLKLKMREDRGQEGEKHVPVEISEGWLGLRELANALCREKGLSERDSAICAWFAVPPVSGMNKVSVREVLIDAEEIPADISRPNFNAVLKRKLFNKTVITPSDLGQIGERWLLALLTNPLVNGVRKRGKKKQGKQANKSSLRIDSLPAHIGPLASGVCDISDRADGDPARAGWAVNVKTSIEDSFSRVFEVSPEHLVSKSWVVLVLPRLLQLRIVDITSQNMNLNENAGLCVTPEGLAQRLKEMIEK